MILIILLSFYVGFTFKGDKIWPESYFLEFEKGKIFYGIGGNIFYSEDKTDVGWEDKLEKNRFSVNFKIGRKIKLKTLGFNPDFLFFIMPGYNYSFNRRRSIRGDSISKWKSYEHQIYGSLNIGIEIPFKIKNIDFRIRVSNPLITCFYFIRELHFFKSFDENEKYRAQGFVIRSQTGRGTIDTSVLIKI